MSNIIERLRWHSEDQATGKLRLTNPDGPEAAAEIERLRAENERLREAKDGAYEERNRVVALLASVFPSGVRKTAIPGWEPEWHDCVYIDLPTGQASWHYHDSQAYLFAHLPPYRGEWDGHTTDVKYERVARAALAEQEDK